MKRVFADSGYWVALLNPQDELHSTAIQISRELSPLRIFTTEMVLVEVANLLGKEGGFFRVLVHQTINGLRQDTNVAIEPQSSGLFRDSLNFYVAHRDKNWSLTDCASFLFMKQAGLTEALAHDHHFMQAGFKALLRNGS